MEKIIPILGLFSLFFIDFANANLQEEYRKKDSLNLTNCNFDNAIAEMDELEDDAL